MMREGETMAWLAGVQHPSVVIAGLGPEIPIMWYGGALLILLRHKFVGCAKSRCEGLATCATALRDFAHAIGRGTRGCTPYLRL